MTRQERYEYYAKEILDTPCTETQKLRELASIVDDANLTGEQKNKLLFYIMIKLHPNKISDIC